jgi:hypothetical protein
VKLCSAGVFLFYELKAARGDPGCILSGHLDGGEVHRAEMRRDEQAGDGHRQPGQEARAKQYPAVHREIIDRSSKSNSDQSRPVGHFRRRRLNSNQFFSELKRSN